jgi:beta-1,4-mannosyl-glycoprotein beta-1,4-N-acetylglucosaminyltransferase
MSKIIDIFSFNGELDILEIRLNILDSVVDEFIICEGDETTAGNPKPRYFEENKERYAKWAHKIKYYIFSPFSDPMMQAFSKAYLPIPIEQHWWHREFIQKESMRYALTHLHDDDRVFIGDVDEIWNPDTVFPEGRAELQQTVYTYYLDNKSSEHWTGTSLMSYKDIKHDTLDNLRAYDERRKHMHAPVIKSGWHFTNQGGYEFVKRKIQSYAHQEFNNPQTLAQIEQHIHNNEDYIGRPFILGKDETGLPEYILQNNE